MSARGSAPPVAASAWSCPTTTSGSRLSPTCVAGRSCRAIGTSIPSPTSTTCGSTRIRRERGGLVELRLHLGQCAPEITGSAAICPPSPQAHGRLCLALMVCRWGVRVSASQKRPLSRRPGGCCAGVLRNADAYCDAVSQTTFVGLRDVRPTELHRTTWRPARTSAGAAFDKRRTSRRAGPKSLERDSGSAGTPPYEVRSSECIHVAGLHPRTMQVGVDPVPVDS